MDKMIPAIEMLIAILLLAGAAISLLSAFGLLRLPDMYLRSHAATKSATLGVICILLAAFLYFLAVLDHFSIRLLLGIVFVFMTAPISGHLSIRAAYRTGVPLWDKSVRDDLRPVLEKERQRELE